MLPKWWPADPRYYQIAALGALLAVSMTVLDLGARPLPSALAIVGALAAQALCSWLWRLPRFDWRSPLITGLSLSLLLRADEPWLHAAAAAIAILSKFVLRIDGKHVWNPAGFAIVMLLLGTDHVWISPGQWGASLWFAAFVAFLAILVLQASRRSDIALFFLGSHAALLLLRAWWLGDPAAIPLHQLESGSLLIFAFFMISDPQTSPDCAAGALPVRARRGAAGALARLLHADATGALCRADRALAVQSASSTSCFPPTRFNWATSNRQGASS